MKKCILILLDGLGDRAYEIFGHQTPLQAAHTPALDHMAAVGTNGLYHAAQLGLALPSEKAHFAIFGYDQVDFPGRGALEALGAGVPLTADDVALLTHISTITSEDRVFFLKRDTPPATVDEITELIPVIKHFVWNDIDITFHHIGKLFGVLVLRGSVSPFVTDTNPMRDDAFMMNPVPWKSHALEVDAVNTAKALKAYLIHVHQALNKHPVNVKRKKERLPPLNGLVTQRAGRLKRVTPFSSRYGLKGLSIASGAVFGGLSKYIGLDFQKIPAMDNPQTDLSKRLAKARDSSRQYDFIHVHTKAPDEAAHMKDPEFKKRVIESLDRAIGGHLDWLLGDPDILTVVTSDHSTPSRGPLVHSGEPVPLTLCGEGVRRDAVVRFDEISVAAGALGTVRDRELMYLILNHLDRIKLMDIMDTDEDQMFWPGRYEPFKF
ncbi:MAG: alkaline phosphatase family protein [Syntrophales bacterium]|jgi:2,3-bisphosphoglycerate-independent phosphoglycerate mutase|nr:alkaline phosphatase family protein [Syntrophales bacterium]